MRALLILLLLIAGLGVWFWLLLRQAPEPALIERVEVTHEEPASAERAAEASLEIPEGAPPQTDVGMEFPVLEE